MAITGIAGQPVIADAAADAVGGGQLGHRVETGEIFRDELKTLIHG